MTEPPVPGGPERGSRGRRVLLVSALVGLTLASVVLVALYSPLGLGVAERWVQSRLPDVRYDAVSGRLAGPIRVVGLRVSAATSLWAADTIDVQWRPLALLRRRVAIDEVRVTGVVGQSRDVRPAPPESSASEPRRPPLPVSVGVLDVRSIQLPSNDGTIETVAVGDLSIASVVQWTSFRVAWADGAVDLSGQVDLVDRLTFDIEARLEAIVRDEATRARAHISGGLDTMAMVVESEQPIHASVEGHLHDLQTTPSVDVVVTLAETDSEALVRLLRLANVQVDEAQVAGTVRGVVRVVGVADSLDLDGAASLGSRDFGAVEVAAQALVLDSTAIVRRFSVQREDARVDGRGSVSRRAPIGGEVTAVWSALSWPLDDPDVTSPQGRIELTGRLDDFDVEVDARWRHRSGLAGRLDVAGEGTGTSFRADHVDVELLGGSVTGQLETDWVTTPRWDVAFEARELHTRSLVTDTASFGGILSGNGSARGRLRADRLTMTVQLDTVRGTVGRGDVEASSYTSVVIPRGPEGFDLEGGQARVEWLEALWGPNHLVAAGRVADTVEAHITIRAPSLSAVTPRASGEVEALVRLAGSRGAPAVGVVALATDLRLDSMTIDTIEVAGEVGAGSGEVADGAVRLRSIALGERTADSVSLRFSGTRAEHRADVRVDGRLGRVTLVADGSLHEAGWAATVTEGLLFAEPFGEWTLEEQVSLEIEPDNARIGSSCWTSDDARACLEATWSRPSSRLSASVEAVPMATLMGDRMRGWDWVGTAASRLDVTVDSTGFVSLGARLDGAPGYAVAPGGRRFDFSASTATLSSDSTGARAAAEARMSDVAGNEVVSLRARASTTEPIRLGDPWRSLPIEASVLGHIDVPAAIAADLPVDVDSLEGVADFDLRATGSIDDPRVEGFAEWRSGSFVLPGLAARVTDIEVRAEGAGGDVLDVRGAFRMGGTAELGGRIPLNPSRRNPATFQLVGEELVVSDRAGFEVVAGLDVEAVVTVDSVLATGTVSIDDATIEADELDVAVVRASNDVVFVDDTLGAPARATRVDLTVLLGDSVRFDGAGLAGRPSGTLNLRGPLDLLIGSGDVTIRDGTYQAYGQRLDIERGRLLFAGSTVLDPGLDVRASRTAQDGVVAGVEVAGTLRRPVLTVFSEPTMPEIETLSYIMVGRPWSEATSTESTRITDAAAAEGLRRSNALTRRIPLADVRVQADGPLEEASLVAGRQFSSRLYVSYGYGLFQPISTFRLRYILSQRWTFQAESGAAAGADLLFRIERGR